MASVKKQKSGGYSVRIRWDGKELGLWGYTNRREAERFGQKLDELRACKKTGSLTPEMRVWADELTQTNPKIYDRLASAGLLPERQKKHTLGELLTAYNARVDVKEETKWTWRLISNNLREFFTETKPLEEITQEDAVKFERWLQTTPLNSRTSTPCTYSKATVHKRISHAKNIFTYAERLG